MSAWEEETAMVTTSKETKEAMEKMKRMIYTHGTHSHITTRARQRERERGTVNRRRQIDKHQAH